jgi:hypothetical protein
MPRRGETEGATKWVLLFIAGLVLFLAAAWNPFATVRLGPIPVPLFFVEVAGGLMVAAAYWKLREVV